MSCSASLHSESVQSTNVIAVSFTEWIPTLDDAKTDCLPCVFLKAHTCVLEDGGVNITSYTQSPPLITAIRRVMYTERTQSTPILLTAPSYLRAFQTNNIQHWINLPIGIQTVCVYPRLSQSINILGSSSVLPVVVAKWKRIAHVAVIYGFIFITRLHYTVSHTHLDGDCRQWACVSRRQARN